jgi:transposase
VSDWPLHLSPTQPPQGIPGCPRCGWLTAQLILLQQRVSELEAQVAKNSRNSHKPPSSDGYSKPAPKSLREKSNRPSGGQEGHPGHSLAKVDTPDHVVLHRLRRCPCGCGASLRRLPLIRRDTRQVFDLPPQKLIVTEHQVEVKICPTTGREVSAAFPEGVDAPTQYSPRFNAWLVYLRAQQLLPLERITQMAADLFGALVSQAAVQNAVAKASHALQSFETRVADLIARATVVHADETGVRVAGKLHWLHVAATKLLTWYGVSRRRGTEAIHEFDVLTRFTGRLVHDCLSAYFKLACLHGLCNAHLLRELRFLFEVQGQVWAKSMFDLLQRMHRSVLAQKERDGPAAAVQLMAWIDKYRDVLRQGFAENPVLAPPGPKRRGRPKHSKAQNLLFRLQEHESSVLAFLHDFRVPFTNNPAEQDLRMMKVQQKISGTFRTLQGALMFARIRSYLSTVRKNNRDVFQDIIAALSGDPFIPTFAG